MVALAGCGGVVTGPAVDADDRAGSDASSGPPGDAGPGQGDSGTPAGGDSGADLDPALTATLSWSEPTTNADGSPLLDLAGYRVHFGTRSRTDAGFVAYDTTLDVRADAPSLRCSGQAPRTCEVELALPAPGTYYFAVRAYDSSGNVGDYAPQEPSKTL